MNFTLITFSQLLNYLLGLSKEQLTKIRDITNDILTDSPSSWHRDPSGDPSDHAMPHPTLPPGAVGSTEQPKRYRKRHMGRHFRKGGWRVDSRTNKKYYVAPHWAGIGNVSKSSLLRYAKQGKKITPPNSPKLPPSHDHSFSSNLARFMSAKAWSPRIAATKFNVSPASVSCWLSGKWKPSHRRNIGRVCQVMNKTAKELGLE